MKHLLVVLSLCLTLAGCGAKRTSNSSTPATPITTWEQINFDNLQIAVHNRAAAKAAVAAYQLGFIEKEYFDTISKEGVNITKLHQQLTPLLSSEATAKASSDKIKSILNRVVASAGTIADIAGKGDPTSKQALVSEAQLVQSLANSILVLLQGAGVITERRTHERTNSGEAYCLDCRPVRYYSGRHPDHQASWGARA